MKNLLARSNAAVLAQLAWSRVLIAFDFDGTLAPIVAKREAAGMRALTSELFAAVCAAYPCAIISGRSQADVALRLGQARVKYVVGNHGLEPGANLEEFAQEVAGARDLLSAALGGLPGLDLEDKRYSLALHYRRSRQRRQTRTAILAAVQTLPVRLRVVPGKLVINLVPERAPNKADALLKLRALEGADTALYVGDDLTDEDVFEIDQPGRLLTARVGLSSTSFAKYYLRSQREIDSLLDRLIELRPAQVQA